MSISTRSRSSSLFSLTSTTTSRTSPPTSPRTTGWVEELEASAAPLVLQRKPQPFTTAFSSSRSTYLRFTAFPPQNVPKATFERIGVEVAMSLIHQGGDPTVLSMFATAQSQVTPTYDNSGSSDLPIEFEFVLQSKEWDCYTITGTAPLPISIGSMNTTFRHCVAFRKLRNGLEWYNFGPGGLRVHSICQLQDAGAQSVEDIPRETLYLEETTEVLCSKALKWWLERRTSTKTAESHELLRVRWDARFRAEVVLRETSEKVDLLA